MATSETKWTPGPCRFERTDNEEHDADLDAASIHGSILGGPRSMIIARIWADGGHPAGDAALIAAAPLLHAALVTAVDQADHEDDCPEFGFDAAPDTCTCWKAGARAALAKAEG